MGTVGPAGGRGWGGVKIDFRKTSFLSVWWRNFFLMFQGGSPRVKKDSVNLTFNAFCIEIFHQGTLWFPGVQRGYCKIAVFRDFYVVIILTPWGSKLNPPEGVRAGIRINLLELQGCQPPTHSPHLWIPLKKFCWSKWFSFPGKVLKSYRPFPWPHFVATSAVAVWRRCFTSLPDWLSP